MKASRPLLVLLGLALAGVAAALWVLANAPQRDTVLPKIVQLPDFSLVDTQGKTVSLKDLSGRPWVADLIFTSCSGICPRMTGEMQRLWSDTGDLDDLRFVSITVDPERDTPEVLAAYAARAGADPARWLFLTGEREEIWRLAREGLLLPVAKGNVKLGDEEIIHSQRFVLVDGEGAVRGTYDVRDAEALARLRNDIRQITVR